MTANKDVHYFIQEPFSGRVVTEEGVSVHEIEVALVGVGEALG